MFVFRFYLLLLLAFSTTVIADHLPEDVEPGTSINDIALPLTRETAAELAQIETGGKVLSVDQEQQNHHTVFRVKVLHDNGKIKTYSIDQNTGHTIH